MPELVRIDHRADRLDPPAEQVERQRADHLAVPIAEDRTRLPIHVAWLDAGVPIRTSSGKFMAENAGHLVGAGHRIGECRRLAATVPDHLDVRSEQLLQTVDVAFTKGVEESRGQLVSLPAIRLEPRTSLVHVATRAHRELPARRLRATHCRRNLGEAEPEHLAQDEDRALERAEPFEQHQGGHRHRVRQLCRPFRVLVRVGEQRLRKPLPDVLLTTHACRPEDIDRDPRDHRREERPG